MSRVKYLNLSLLLLLLLMYSTTFAAEYTVPKLAYSVYAEDLDLDGDKDIVVGHLYNSSTNWTGITILENINAEFSNIDSFYLNGQHRNLCIGKIDNNDDFDLTTQCYNGTDSQIGFLFDFYYNQSNLTAYNISEYVDDITNGDIDNDNDIDIIVASNHGQFWGVMYNDGDGEFSLPDYYYVDYFPSGIACGDINNDGRDDIVVCGLKLEIYLSYPDSFQYILADETNYQNEIEIGDIDNDGDIDLIVSRYGAPHLPHFLQIYNNDGDCNFTLSYEEAIPIGISDIQLTDLNNDSYLDIIYTKVHGQKYVCVRMNNGDGVFLDEENYDTNLGCIQCFSADLDGNDWNDIITTCGGNNISTVYILFNDTTGNFVEEPQFCIDEENEIFYNISNYPNPFHNTTTISFSVRGQYIRNPEVMIYNLKGQLVKELENITKIDSCNYSVQWDGKNNNSREVANGVYLFTLRLGDKSISKRMLIVR